MTTQDIDSAHHADMARSLTALQSLISPDQAAETA
jgi:hypothetical protein